MCYLLVCRLFVPLVILGDMSLRDMLLVINCVSVICDIFYLDVWFSIEPHTRSIVDQERNLQSPRPSQDHQPPHDFLSWNIQLPSSAPLFRLDILAPHAGTTGDAIYNALSSSKILQLQSIILSSATNLIVGRIPKCAHISDFIRDSLHI